MQPDWLLGLPLEEVERLQRERIRRDVSDFAGLIDTWDAINEVVIMPVFEGGENGITPLARGQGPHPHDPDGVRGGSGGEPATLACC